MNRSFQDDGYYLARSVIHPVTVQAWADLYRSLADENRVPEYNPVAINQPQLQPLLSIIARNFDLLDVVQEIWGPNIALYNQRFVVKDKHSRGPVMWHQDTPYHIGFMNKCSAFVALSESSQRNGGLQLMRGTHKYGYLGDAGEINTDCKPDGCWISEHEMKPGDVLFMHSACWHCSPPHMDGPDRILADIIYQPADDPSGKELLRGEWKTHDRISEEMREKLFVRSRSMRLKELQTKLDEYERTDAASN